MLSASDAKEVRIDFIDCSEIDDILKRSRTLFGSVITKEIFIPSEVVTLRGPSMLPFFISQQKICYIYDVMAHKIDLRYYLPAYRIELCIILVIGKYES